MNKVSSPHNKKAANRHQSGSPKKRDPTGRMSPGDGGHVRSSKNRKLYSSTGTYQQQRTQQE